MKQTLCALCFGALTIATVNAQAVLGYDVSQQEGTYTPLEGATVLYQGADATVTGENIAGSVLTPDGIVTNSGTVAGFDLGTTFNIAGESFTSFLVSPAGYILFGNGEMEYNAMMKANFMTYGTGYTIAGFGVNFGVEGTEETTVSYQISGDGDDAELAVEFANLAVHSTFFAVGGSVDIQVRVDAAGNVRMVFNNFDNIEDESATLKFWPGVRQDANYVCASGDSGSLTLLRNDRNTANFGKTTPNGTTITFSAPKDCTTPSEQATDLAFTRTSDSISGSFEAAGDADTWLVVYASGDKVAGTPEDGVTYTAGSELGDGTVAYFGPKTSFNVYNVAGGTDFTFNIYAASSYGFNGPKYLTASPLSGSVATLPTAPGEVVATAATTTSITINIADNGTDDEVVVLYTNYCERDNYGDHGLFGELTAETAQDDVLEAPDYTSMYYYEGAPTPENGGIVAYVGKAGEVVISDLTPSTMYYVAVYTRNANGEYTSSPVFTGWSTDIEYPYEGESFNYPRYQLPYGWSGSEAGATTFAARDEIFWNNATKAPSQGTQVVQQRFTLTGGNATTGKEAWMIPAPIVVAEKFVTASFDYCITMSPSRFATEAYNDWLEGDVLNIEVSEDNGETWNVVENYTPSNHPYQETITTYVNISADLSDYVGKTVLVRLYWKTFLVPFSAYLTVDRFSLVKVENKVPVVTVGELTSTSAVVSWTAAYEDYELAYAQKDSDDYTIVAVEGASAYTINGLEANTEYKVKVRGVSENEESGETEYSEWSDIVYFTTADYPAVEAPENLTADIADSKVVLSWDAIEEAETYEVAIRMSTSTEWTYKESSENSLVLDDLEGETTYVWKVRAFCTHDRTTDYSAQARFTTPKFTSGLDEVDNAIVITSAESKVIVSGAEGEQVMVYTLDGILTASTDSASQTETFVLRAGAYIVTVSGKSVKVIVR